MSPRLHVDSRTAVPGAHGQAVSRWAANRRPYIDNLKITLIAAIIAIHGVLGYAHLIGALWPYANVQETRLTEPTETILLVVVAPFAVFMIALLFLTAGLLTPASVERKGPGRYIRGRLLRLGVPFAAFTLVLWPTLLYYTLYHPFGHASGSYWEEFVGADAVIDFGPLWFVGVLLIFSVTYGIHVAARRSRPADPAHRGLSVRSLVLLSAAVAAATFVVRLAFPLASERFPDLNLWQWPACAGLFGLGIIASRQGWLETVPDRIRRRSRDVTALAVLAMATIALLITADIPGVTPDDLAGGMHWPALAFAVVEALLTVFGSVWLFAVSQRRFDRLIRLGPVLGPVLARSAYGAFILQGPVLIGLAVALRPVPVPAELKALIVATGGVYASFALAWLLISRIPALSRVL